MTSSEQSNSMLNHVPNFLSLLRGVLGIALPFLILSQNPSHYILASFLFAFGSITDFLDGYIARKYNIVSAFGKFIDPVTDKILILLPLWAFSKLGFYSVWILVPIFFRELSVTFIRIGWMLDKEVVAAERMGKWKFGIQVAAVGMSLLVLMSPHVSGLTNIQGVLSLLMMTLIVLTLFLSVYSGIDLCLNNKKLFQSQSFAKYVSAAGLGLLPKAPGTWGTVVGLFVVCMVRWNYGLFAAFFVIFTLLGVWSVSKLDLSKQKDPGFITLDEVCGIFVTFAWGPFNWKIVIIGFILFRFFDIVKPFPLRRLEKLPRFWGIWADDVGAGLYACLLLNLPLFGL